jgi:uncharacterized membrane protein YGL010W
MIAVSVAVMGVGFFWRGALWCGIGLFAAGWLLQFVGHAIEGERPEFLRDWRFLLVGTRWWLAKMRGRV